MSYLVGIHSSRCGDQGRESTSQLPHRLYRPRVAIREGTVPGVFLVSLRHVHRMSRSRGEGCSSPTESSKREEKGQPEKGADVEDMT